MKIHELKTWPEYFEAVSNGSKTFEIRKNDREFSVGDTITLKEFDPKEDKYTGHTLEVIVTYMTDFEQQPGYVILGIEFFPYCDMCGEDVEQDELFHFSGYDKRYGLNHTLCKDLTLCTSCAVGLIKKTPDCVIEIL